MSTPAFSYSISDDLFYQIEQFTDGEIGATADIDQGWQHGNGVGGDCRPRQRNKSVVGQIHQEHARVGHIVAVEQFTARRARAPCRHVRITRNLASCTFRISAGSTCAVFRS